MKPSLGVSVDKWQSALVAWVLVAAVLLHPAIASAQSGDITVREIQVVGAQRVDPDTVRSYMRVQPGDVLGPRSINQALKSLFETGYFSDASIDMRGDVMVVRVAENPIVNRIAFEGNRRIDDETLTPELQLKPRQIFTRSAAEKDVKRILGLYRRSGRFAANVEAKIIELSQNRVDVVFEITEGSQTLIEKIIFIGNKQFSDSDLLGEISSKEAAWYRFLSTDDVYDPDRMAFDRELLRAFYLSRGYVDFRVTSAVAELTPDQDGFILTFTLEEGPQYAFGTISLENKLTDVPDFRLSVLLKPRSGEIYDDALVRETVDDLVDEVGTFGFAFVDVQPRSNVRREDREVDLVFRVDEGPRVYVERIDVEGNLRTLDRVVRREFGIVEGDAFNSSKIARATRKVRNLGYFRKVDVTNERGSNAERARVRIKVEEAPTGEFSIGAGYSSESGALVSLRLSERNLLGKGQDLTLATSLSEEQNEVEISFTEPYFQDQPISVGADVFRVAQDDEDLSYEQERFGGRFRVGYELSEDWYQRWRYTAERRVYKFRPSETTRARKSSTNLSEVGHEVMYDTRDNRFHPTSGSVFSISNDLAGLGGQARYLRTDVRGTEYLPMSKRPPVTLALSGRVGAIHGLGKDVEIGDRYYLGGRTLRGFEFGGVGPRSKRGTRAPLGGNYIATTTAELIFPVSLSADDLGLRARLFTDFGTLTGVDERRTASNDFHDESSIRGSLGFGISWTTPIGPLRLDFAWPVVKEDFDEDETLLFSIGTQF